MKALPPDRISWLAIALPTVQASNNVGRAQDTSEDGTLVTLRPRKNGVVFRDASNTAPLAAFRLGVLHSGGALWNWH